MSCRPRSIDPGERRMIRRDITEVEGRGVLLGRSLFRKVSGTEESLQALALLWHALLHGTAAELN